MTGVSEVYRCKVCGNIVEVLHAGAGKLVCCGQPMELLEERTEDQGYEKHVPVVEEAGGGILVKVGSVPHPMEEEHHIEWVEVASDRGTWRRFLRPGERPEAGFPLKAGDVKQAREYCNVHGLWKG